MNRNYSYLLLCVKTFLYSKSTCSKEGYGAVLLGMAYYDEVVLR